MSSTYNEGKYVVAERFIRDFKTKTCKYISSIPKNVYVYKLDYIVNEYNNTYHNTIKMRPVDVKSSTYTSFGIKENNKDPKFEVGDHIR